MKNYKSAGHEYDRLGERFNVLKNEHRALPPEHSDAARLIREMREINKQREERYRLYYFNPVELEAQALGSFYEASQTHRTNEADGQAIADQNLLDGWRNYYWGKECQKISGKSDQ